MTVSTNPTRADYDGNGTATTFPYAFPVSSPTDIKVWQLVTTNPLDAVQTLLTLDVDYSVTMLTASSGYVTRLSGALPADYHWTIILDLTYEQPTSIKNQGQFYEDVHEAAFDRNVLLTKQVSELIGRTITLPVTLTDVTTEIDNLIDGAAFGLVSKPGGGWQVIMVANSGAQQTADLANTGTATKGAGMVGFDYTTGYGAGTVGLALKDRPTSAQVVSQIASQIVSQTPVAFTTGGTSTAYTLTPSPVLAAYATGTRYHATIHMDSGANPTMNISTLGAKNLKQYDSTGAKVAPPLLKAGQRLDLVYDGTDLVILNPLPPSAPSDTGRLIGYQVFSATGTSSYTKGTNNPSFVIVEVQGAGGSGGAVYQSTTNGSAASGGAAGGYSKKKIAAASLAASETVTVGAGGAAVTGNSSGVNGNAGGSSSFGSHCSATGGARGTATSGTPAMTSGAQGGAGSGGDINTIGQGSSGASMPGGAAVSAASAGGSSVMGGGGGALIGTGTAQSGGIGAGGGGAANNTSSGPTSGKGGDGMVIVWEYA